jgi:uroporphyrin-III C-methyltransferase
MSGKVFLVGAGPGDPDLLTVKAVRLLQQADAVLYDELVSPEILNLVSPFAQLHNVGKLCGRKKITQSEINFLMAGLAASGFAVVRLKSGDPLIFGRVGEEIEALREAKIDFEIVPGVTSAFGAAATAEIPLTHRHASPAVILLTGHRAPENGDADWRKFVASGATLVIYMPGHHYAAIATRLKAAGALAHTPCVIMSRATTPQQQVYATNVGELHTAPRLPGPTLLVVGEVVRFAKSGLSKPASVDSLFGIPNLSAELYAHEEVEHGSHSTENRKLRTGN